MSNPKSLTVKEGLKKLKQLKKNSSLTKIKRLLMLIEIKKEEGNAISKRQLAIRLGVDPNSITAWKKLYEQGGIKAIMSDRRIGFKPSVIPLKESKAIEGKLEDANKGESGNTEQLDRVKPKSFKKKKYTEKHFADKIKIVRKIDAKKDKEAVETLKKL
jgi:transposase